MIAERNNPRVDLLFCGPVETFAAGINDGIFEPYKPVSFDKLPIRIGMSASVAILERLPLA